MEMVWLIYSTAEPIGQLYWAGHGRDRRGSQVDTGFFALPAHSNLVWRFLSQIFYWITDLIGIERWEGTIGIR